MINPPAVVLDLSANGNAIIRSLARKGITVYAYDVERKYKIGKTRLAHCAPCPDPLTEEEALLQLLIKHGATFPMKPVLYTASDDFLFFLSKYRNELSNYYLFLLPTHELIEQVLDKQLTYELATANNIASPKTFVINDESTLKDIIPELCFPCLLKPAMGHKFRRAISKKAIIVDNATDLIKQYSTYKQYGELLVQELIPGDEDQIYQVGTFFNDEMKLIGLFMGQKLNQYPPYFGAGARVISMIDEEVMEKGKQFLEAIECKGIAVAEFKRDARDGQLKFIEINARTWLWHGLSESCGIDLSYLYYLELTGQHPEPRLKQKEGITWIYLIRDFLSIYEKRKHGKASFRSWFKGLRGKKVYALLSSSEVLPFFRSTYSHIINHWKNQRKQNKLKRKERSN